MSTSWKLLWQIKSKAIFTCCFENCTKKDQCSTCGVVTKTNFFMLKFLFSWVALNTFTVWSVFRIIVSTVYFLNSRLWIAAEFFTHFFSIPTWGSFRQGSLSTYQPLELFRIILLKIWNFKFCFLKSAYFLAIFFQDLLEEVINLSGSLLAHWLLGLRSGSYHHQCEIVSSCLYRAAELLVDLREC